MKTNYLIIIAIGIMTMKKFVYILLLAIFLPLPASAHELSGTAKVIDGDTIEIGGTVVRLLGIDAAETGQRCVSS